MSNAIERWREHVPKAAIKAFREENSPPVLFIGSGMGKEARPSLPTSYELLRAACGDLNIKHQGESLADILQYLKNESAGKWSVAEWLRRRLQSKPGGAHHLLLHLPCREFITTNYDDVLLNAASELNYAIRRAVTGAQYRKHSGRSRGRSAAVLGQLHGSLRDSDNLVATTDDYISNYAREGAAWRELLQNLFRRRTVVFIGYSLRDFTTWTSYIATRLRTRHQRDSYRPHLMVSPNSGDHVASFWKNYGVNYVPLTAAQFLTVVHYELGNFQHKHIAAAVVAAVSRVSVSTGLRRLERRLADRGWSVGTTTYELVGEAAR